MNGRLDTVSKLNGWPEKTRRDSWMILFDCALDAISGFSDKRTVLVMAPESASDSWR